MNKTLLPDSLAKRLENRLDSLKESALSQGIDLPRDKGFIEELERAFMFSEFIASKLITHPEVLMDLFCSNDFNRSYKIDNENNDYAVSLGSRLKDITNFDDLRLAVADTRLREMIRISWRDLNHKAPLSESLRDLSAFADACVQKVISYIYDEFCLLFGTPCDARGQKQGIVVLGMGKLGAGELNFSSDIDLIFAYPEDTDMDKKGRITTSGEFFTRLCRKFLKVFDPSMGESMIFRVDTRLRPFGANGPMVMSFDALEIYYQSQGRDWERYAFIKARPVAGDIHAGYRLLEKLKPFIYRRYFDYGAFESFRDMKKRIEIQVRDRRLKNNIKLGAGGIREIEFFGQIFQLIRGGVEPEFQERKILSVLELLVREGFINQEAGDVLKLAYCFLRNVEHRLQEYNDQQTHEIPGKYDDRFRLALSMGFEHPDDFLKDLEHHMGNVHKHFNRLLVAEKDISQGDDMDNLAYLWDHLDDPQYEITISRIPGFKNSGELMRILRFLAEHPNTKKLTASGRKRLNQLVPILIREASRQNEPETVLSKLQDLVIAIERRTCYISLLLENPQAVATLAILALKSPWIISFVSKHPALLDELLDTDSLYLPPDRDFMENELQKRMAMIPDDDFEYQMEELCLFKQINMLRVAAADISGNFPLMKVSDRLTYIAEIILQKVLEIAWKHTTAKYGFPSTTRRDRFNYPGFAVIAYGKLGGFELGYRSDIDLVFIHSSAWGMTRGGRKSIDNIQFYTLLGQRMIHMLTQHTQAGRLYETDMRLRPSGKSGMIVSHMDGFREYIFNQAWTWEHQAIIRARPVCGDMEIKECFNSIRREILMRERDPSLLQKEVQEMRERLRHEFLESHGEYFDLKQGRGGIIDIEFIVQYLVLRYAEKHPDLTVWTDNVRQLETLVKEGILLQDDADILKSAYLKFRRAAHHLNLEEKSQKVPVEYFSDISARTFAIYKKFLYI